jgi:phosphatidylserine synthase
VNNLIGYLCYFGSLLVPGFYLLATGFRGACTRTLLKQVASHLLSYCLVWLLAMASWKNGDSEYYWLWGLLIPVNVLFLVLYVLAIVKSKTPGDLPK